jgi:ketosteroid isomerase-like protein
MHAVRKEASMSLTRTPTETFLALVHGICERRSNLSDLYSENTSVAHPFDPLKRPELVGREALRRHFGAMQGVPKIKASPTNIHVHQTADPEVNYAGHVIESGQAYSYPCIFVMRVRNGEILESRDYVDHIGSAEARGALTDFLQQISQKRLAGPAAAG